MQSLEKLITKEYNNPNQYKPGMISYIASEIFTSDNIIERVLSKSPYQVYTNYQSSSDYLY